MKTTMTISANTNTSPFEVMDQDVDEVIMLINFYIALGADKKKQAPSAGKINTQDAAGQPKRVRVTDATATGGWF